MPEMEYLTKEVHNEFAARVEEQNERQNKRLEKLEESIEQMQELISSVKVLAVNMEQMAKEQGKMSTRLEAIESKPAENWDKAIWAIGGAVIGVVIAFVLKAVGIG